MSTSSSPDPTKDGIQDDTQQEVLKGLFSFKTKFEPNYFFSMKSKSLKCFPDCGSSHMEKSFCGSFVEVQMTQNSSYLPKDLFLFSEISLKGKEGFRVGDEIKMDLLINPKKNKIAKVGLKTGALSDERFIFHPDRNWEVSFPTSASASEEVIQAHFTFYVVHGSKIIFKMQSAEFRLKQTCTKKKKSKDVPSTTDVVRVELKRLDSSSLSSLPTALHSSSSSSLVSNSTLVTLDPSSPLSARTPQEGILNGLTLKTLLSPLSFDLYYHPELFELTEEDYDDGDDEIEGDEQEEEENSAGVIRKNSGKL